MASIKAPASTLSLVSRCFRLTARGQACLDVDDAGAQSTGSLSPYLHDVLEMCGTGVWFEQLQQFMPPRSLDESLRSLLALGLIETMAPDQAPCYVQPARRRTASMFGDLHA